MNKVLLIALRHRDDKFGDNSKTSFANTQVHTSWSEAISKLGYICIEFPIDRITLSSSNVFLVRIINGFLRRVIGFLQDIVYAFRLLLIFLFSVPKIVLLSGASGKIIPLVVYFYNFFFSCKTVFVGTMDPIFYSKSELFFAKNADLVVNNGHIKAWEELDIQESITLPMSAADSDFHAKFNRNIQNPICDIAFIGSIHGKNYESRLEMLSWLNDYDLGIWTISPNAIEILKKFNLEKNFKGSISRLGCPEIYSSSLITINTHAHDMFDGGNLGTFEIPGSSGFQVVDYFNAEWFIDSEEVISYKGKEDLIEKINLYLKNDSKREAIMNKGRMRALKSHTYENRFQKIFQILGFE